MADATLTTNLHDINEATKAAKEERLLEDARRFNDAYADWLTAIADSFRPAGLPEDKVAKLADAEDAARPRARA